MSKQFGKTWWGKQWLNSLTHIDYDNRLPRGSAYARKGAVRQISIENNMIHAKVQGSRPKPYEVTVVIPPFFDKDIKELVTAIARKPVIISKLLNRELDPEVLDIAEGKGLKVFPRQWADFKMVCNSLTGRFHASIWLQLSIRSVPRLTIILSLSSHCTMWTWLKSSKKRISMFLQKIQK